FGVYPMVLPARNPAFKLTVQNAKAADYGLKNGLIWWVIGMALATVYFVTSIARSPAKSPKPPIRPATGISYPTGTERPGEVARPVRESKVPSGERMPAPSENVPRLLTCP